MKITALKSLNMNDPKSPHDGSGDLVNIQTFEATGDLQLVHGYGDHSFRISGNRYSGSVLLGPRKTAIWTPPANPADLKIDDILPGLGMALPPLFILGVGGAPMDPMNDLAHYLREQGIALEVMSTAAACRTWNVLMSEGRTACAGLYAVA